MSHVRGIHTLDDLKARCVIDDITGCWIWKLAVKYPNGHPTPYAHPTLPGGRKRQSMTAARAAWILAGKPLEKGEKVWRHACNNFLCVNPDHCIAGSDKAAHRKLVKLKRNVGRPHRQAANRLNSMSWTTPAPVIADIERRLNAGELRKDIAKALGVCPDVVTEVRQGRHIFCSSKPHRVVQGASVFSYRP